MAVPVADRATSISLILTSRCNLGCGYCFQNSRRGDSMEWETIRTALDIALGSRREAVEISFYGGEPLLEFPMIRRAVEYVEERATSKVRWALTTNGVLITPEVFVFLADRHFDTQLSFDGIPDAQQARGPGTFETLDRLLDRLMSREPRFYYENLRIGVTFTPATIDHLAESMDYFLEKDIRRIVMAPVYTFAGVWDPEMIHLLEDQVDRIVARSIRHHRETGRTPVDWLRPASPHERRREEAAPMCGVGRGDSPVVDVDGQVYGCVTFAGSYQKFPSRFLEERLNALRLGDFRDPGFSARYDQLPATIAATDIFSGKEKKHSAHGACASCEFRNDCVVCPVSIGYIPGNHDPYRVPDMLCAWSQVTLRARKEFAVRTCDQPSSTPDEFRRHVSVLRSIPAWIHQT